MLWADPNGCCWNRGTNDNFIFKFIYSPEDIYNIWYMRIMNTIQTICRSVSLWEIFGQARDNMSRYFTRELQDCRYIHTCIPGQSASYTSSEYRNKKKGLKKYRGQAKSCLFIINIKFPQWQKQLFQKLSVNPSQK